MTSGHMKSSSNRIGTCHLPKVSLPNKRVPISPLNDSQQFGPRPRKNIPDERNVVLLGHIIMFAMNTRITRQRQPRSRLHTDAAEQINAVSLRGEHQVEPRRLLAAAAKIKVRIDRPERAGPAIPGQVIAQSVVDIEVEIEAGARYMLELVRLKMLNLD